MFESDEKGGWSSLHHPFTAPRDPSPEALIEDPGGSLSCAYDLVLNGSEVGGGSMRIHSPEMQSAVFELLGISAEEAQAKFGFLLTALDYGCPPHGGIAFGLDRLHNVDGGCPKHSRDHRVSKTQNANCLLTGAPSPVDPPQLRELGIGLRTRRGA